MSVRRYLLVTLGLASVGAVIGSVAAMAAFFLGELVRGAAVELRIGASGYAAVAMIGAAVGAVAAPLFGWFVLRYVPLGRAMLWTAIGTVVGGAVGWRAGVHPIATGLAGFAVASLLARFYSRRRQTSATKSSESVES
jgi:hypothetical protein